MALGLDALNDMLRSWLGLGVDVLLQTGFSRNDAFVLFVPPTSATSKLIDALIYQGAWNASTNMPALASSSGTKGQVYRVSNAGATALDLVTSWVVDDFLVFDGVSWLKSQASSRHESAIIAMLAVRIADEFGREPGSVLVRDARNGWLALQADYIIPAANTFDSGLTKMPSQRYWP